MHELLLFYGLLSLIVIGGFVYGAILSEDSENVGTSYSSCYLEEGVTYYIRIKAEAAEVQLSVNSGNCVWEIVERTEATCEKAGKLVEKCKTHEDEEERSEQTKTTKIKNVNTSLRV